MSRNHDPEKWLANLFSELIRRGLDSDEHIHFKDSPLGESSAPNLEEIRDTHLGWTGEFLTYHLEEHLKRIIEDYQKSEDGLHPPTR